MFVEMSSVAGAFAQQAKCHPVAQFQPSRAVGLKYVMNVTCYDFDEDKQKMSWEHINEVNNLVEE